MPPVPSSAPFGLLNQPAQPSGPPVGSLTWKAQQLGISPYFLAMMSSGSPGGKGGAGQTGDQGRMYMSTFLKRRSANLARAMASQNQQSIL